MAGGGERPCCPPALGYGGVWCFLAVAGQSLFESGVLLIQRAAYISCLFFLDINIFVASPSLHIKPFAYESSSTSTAHCVPFYRSRRLRFDIYCSITSQNATSAEERMIRFYEHRTSVCVVKVSRERRCWSLRSSVGSATGRPLPPSLTHRGLSSSTVPSG